MQTDQFRGYRTFNGPVFHKIDLWSQALNVVGDYFEVKRPTNIVIAPGSDMPYCALKFHPDEPSIANNDGWPAQAANPAAYVSLMDTDQDADLGAVWHPILISHIPTLLQPGWYIPALPQMAYVSDQWDIDHTWPTAVLEYPEVLLMESDWPVESSHYCFTLKAITAGSARDWYTPWLVSPQGNRAGGDIALTNAAGGNVKMLCIGGSNRTGTNQTAAVSFIVYTKCRTFADAAAARNTQDVGTITTLNTDAHLNRGAERYPFFKIDVRVDETGASVAGVGYIIA